MGLGAGGDAEGFVGGWRCDRVGGDGSFVCVVDGPTDLVTTEVTTVTAQEVGWSPSVKRRWSNLLTHPPTTPINSTTATVEGEAMLRNSRDLHADLNNRHEEQEEAELRHGAEYDRDYGAPGLDGKLNRDAEQEDLRCQEEEMHHRADYNHMYGTPEDAYIPPRHNNGGHPKAPPDDNDTAMDGFATFTPRLRAIEWPTSFKPAVNENRPRNTENLEQVRQQKNETLQEYVNHFFENRNRLVGVEDRDIIWDNNRRGNGRRDDHDDRGNRRRDDRHDHHHDDHDHRRDDRDDHDRRLNDRGNHQRNDRNDQHREEQRDQQNPDAHRAGSDQNGEFQQPKRQVNVIMGSPKAFCSNRKHRLHQREVHFISIRPFQYLRWSEMPITFSWEDHWVHIPHPGSNPVVVCPTVDRALLPKVLIDGGGRLNIIFTKTLNRMDFNFDRL
uniref:Retrotransposon gag domain-containing protein n=1 Tax=Setaria viridis TaxID=4556 RepID=A0A4U6TQ87_SETVI|nr:hypothetical protein SEVIR_7G046700v2 [Setaria viridis]